MLPVCLLDVRGKSLLQTWRTLETTITLVSKLTVLVSHLVSVKAEGSSSHPPLLAWQVSLNWIMIILPSPSKEPLETMIFASATFARREDLKLSEENQRNQVPSQTQLKLLIKQSQSVEPVIRKLVEASDTSAM